MAGPSLARLKLGLKGIGNAALSAAKVGFAALTAAALAAAAAIGVAIKGAIDEQAGIARLDQALKTSVKGYQGHTAAIDRLIAKREKLGFSDDDLRANLAVLVTKFKDVGVAGKVQGAAMDVARLKGIKLDAASKLVTQAMDGNERALRQLGIQLPKTATKQERLAAIQKAAAGQAEAYGNTTKGAMESAQIAIADAGETIGAAFLPMVKDMAIWLRDNVGPAAQALAGFITTNVIPAIQGFAKWAGENLLPKLQDVASWIKAEVLPRLSDLWDSMSGAADAIGKVAGPIVATLLPAFGRIAEAIFGKSGGGHNGREGASGGLLGHIGKLIGVLWGDGTGPLPSAMNGIANIFATVVTPAIESLSGILGGVIDTISTAIGWVDKLLTKLREGREAMERQGWTHPAGVPVWVPPQTPATSGRSGNAAGGWVGLHGPQTIRVGENGPEYVSSRGALAAGGSYVAVPFTERQLMDMVDRGLYFKLRRAGTVA